MVVTTGNEVGGRSITSWLGIVRGIVVRSPSIRQGLLGGLRQIIGGNIERYAEVCEKAREDAFERMVQHAQQIGADAVIAMRYDATEFLTGPRRCSPMGPPSSSARTGSAEATLGARSIALFPHPTPAGAFGGASKGLSTDAGRALPAQAIPPLQRHSALSQIQMKGCHYASSLKTRRAFSRRNFDQTGSRKGTWGMSPKIRSSDSPIGK